MTDRRCRADNCTAMVGRHGAKGLCRVHYGRWKRKGRFEKPPFAETFWARVDMSGGPDACWPWTKGCGTFGYGLVFRVEDGRNVPAHCVAWELVNGPLPPGDFGLHSCDNPPCCNPRHIFPGTQVDNLRDRNQKGRANTARGEAQGAAKLNDAAGLR